MRTYRIDIEYDGRAFCGWQRQDGLGLPSVQGEIEQAILDFCGEQVKLCGAGRTDSGVHAIAMTASFELEHAKNPQTICNALNAHLRLRLGTQSAAILSACEMPANFSARFSCTQRHYLYRVLCRSAPTALDAGRVWAMQSAPLDLDAMRSAASDLQGQHDFSAFRTSICQAKSALKSLSVVEISHQGDEFHFCFSARSFLHRQVRIMTGTLVEIGLKRRSVDSICCALSSGQRSDAGKTAPPEGLYFVRADYA